MSTFRRAERKYSCVLFTTKCLFYAEDVCGFTDLVSCRKFDGGQSAGGDEEGAGTSRLFKGTVFWMITDYLQWEDTNIDGRSAGNTTHQRIQLNLSMTSWPFSGYISSGEVLLLHY